MVWAWLSWPSDPAACAERAEWATTFGRPLGGVAEPAIAALLRAALDSDEWCRRHAETQWFETTGYAHATLDDNTVAHVTALAAERGLRAPVAISMAQMLAACGLLATFWGAPEHCGGIGFYRLGALARSSAQHNVVRATVEGGALAWVATRPLGVGEEIIAPVIITLDEEQQQRQRDALPPDVFATLALCEHALFDYFNTSPVPADKLLVMNALPVLEHVLANMKTTLTAHALIDTLPFIDTLMRALQNAGEDVAAERAALAHTLMSIATLLIHLIKKNCVANELIVYSGRPLLAGLLACHAGRTSVPEACRVTFERIVRLAAISSSFVPIQWNPFSSLPSMGDLGAVLYDHLCAARADVVRT